MTDESPEKPLFAGLNDAEILEAQTREKLRTKYKFVFTKSEMATEVLADILCNLCHFGYALENPEEVAQYNVGIYIMGRLGIFSKGNEENLVRALLNTLPKKEV